MELSDAMFKFRFWMRSRRFIFGFCVALSLVLTITIAQYRESNTLHLAMLAPIDGPYQALGTEMVRATQMYLEEINQGIKNK